MGTKSSILAPSSGESQSLSRIRFRRSRNPAFRAGVRGGHLAFRAAMNPDVLAGACFYATDIDTATLGNGDDSLKRAGDIKGELLTVWGRQDPHVPLNGRNLIRARLEEGAANFQWHEVHGQHAFLRD